MDTDGLSATRPMDFNGQHFSKSEGQLWTVMESSPERLLRAAAVPSWPLLSVVHILVLLGMVRSWIRS